MGQSWTRGELIESPAIGQTGQGNIGVHSRQEQRYICHVCGQTFAARKGTVCYRLRTAAETVTLVVTLLAYGCPVQVIVVAFGLDERTVQDWQARARQHCERVDEHLVQQPRDLGQVQADDMRSKMQGGFAWLAMAMQVSTRLWLGATLSTHRNLTLIEALIQRVRTCTLCRPLLFATDGLQAYVHAIRAVFREPVPTGRRGHPRLRPWDGIYITQVVKQYAIDSRFIPRLRLTAPSAVRCEPVLGGNWSLALWSGITTATRHTG